MDLYNQVSLSNLLYALFLKTSKKDFFFEVFGGKGGGCRNEMIA